MPDENDGNKQTIAAQPQNRCILRACWEGKTDRKKTSAELARDPTSNQHNQLQGTLPRPPGRHFGGAQVVT
ncbi:hypothetical protein P8C59_002966 [Phyllachora maydis]|uniref:Uncharacterized protein n=1 Tax=Phyllachora maydis TaxID=1825666 RepID=A0AAD9HZQ6_9PEZI|nr:hypothetical protein P8C59_002966 [Phyllachora maydis]